MKRGRPTQHEQKKIKEIVSQYYEKDISASVASNDSDINYKTFLKYYKTFDNQMLESNEKNFLLRVKTTKERTIQALDKDIITLSKEESRVERLEEEARQTGNLNKFEKLSKLKLKIIDQRIKIQSAKVNLICIPTADIIINEKETLA